MSKMQVDKSVAKTLGHRHIDKFISNNTDNPCNDASVHLSLPQATIM